MYRKFDVTVNLLFAQYFFFKEVNTAQIGPSALAPSAPHPLSSRGEEKENKTKTHLPLRLWPAAATRLEEATSLDGDDAAPVALRRHRCPGSLLARFSYPPGFSNPQHGRPRESAISYTHPDDSGLFPRGGEDPCSS
jgi:hypothetical protein